MPRGRNGKIIPRAAIYRFFLRIPEKYRIRVLQRYLKPEVINDDGKSAYEKALRALREMPKQQAMDWLKDPDKLGAPWETIIRRGETLCGSFTWDIYKKFAPPNPTQADKLYALMMSTTLFGRFASFYQDVTEKVRQDYQRKSLANISTVEDLALRLEHPENFAPGMSLEGFLEEMARSTDLSKVKSATEELNAVIDREDPLWREKYRLAARVLLIQSQEKSDPQGLAERLASPNWEETISPRLVMDQMRKELTVEQLIARTKTNIDDLAETPEEQLLFREAALENCREAKRVYRDYEFAGEAGPALARYTNELQEEIAKQYLTQSEPKALCSSLAEEYLTLTKVKSGFLLSSTNTPEHDAMTKNLRLFNAKLALLQGKEIDALTLNPEEAKTVRDTDLSTLYDDARRGCYNYGCLKTKNGKGGFIHDAGEERFNANMRTLAHLHALGRQLRLGEPAALLRDEVQCQLLENRRNTRWLEQHAADLAAKIIFAQTLLNDGKSWDQQTRLLSGEALEAKLEKIKNQPSFRRMVRSAGPKGLADAMIKGVSHLAELYGQAVHRTEAKGEQPEAKEITPTSLKAQADSVGLAPPK